MKHMQYSNHMILFAFVYFVVTFAALLSKHFIGLDGHINCQNILKNKYFSMPLSACAKLHPERPSGPCRVCNQVKPRYWHIGQAVGTQSDVAVPKLRSLGCTDTDCICQACLKRNAKPECDTPSSSRGTKRTLQAECAVKGCTESERGKLHQTNLLSFPQQTLHIYGLDFSSASATPQSIIATLCHKHYCSIYNHISIKHCTLCGSPKSVLKNCGNIKAAQNFACQILQKEELSTEESFLLCNVCHNSVNRYSKGEKFLNQNRSCKQHFASLLHPFQNWTLENSSAEDLAFAQAVAFIGSELLGDRVVLLQGVYRKYCDKYQEAVSSNSPQQHFSPRSLHSFLLTLRSAIGECLIFSSIPGKSRCGTMIRRHGTDICTALHMLVFNQQKSDVSAPSLQEPPPRFNISHISLSCVSDEINNHLTTSARQIIASDKVNSYQLDTFDFHSEIKRLPAAVWNFVVACTMGPSELPSSHFSGAFNWDEHFLADTHPSSSVSRSKMLKRYFIASSLLYATNEACFTHLHMAITDIVDRFTSSSTQCFEYLSKFGVTVSKSTFLRFQTLISKREMTQKQSVLSGSFCVSSVDNIDKSTSFAAVRVGHESRGFHGTSVQSAEPLPISTEVSGGSSVKSGSSIGHAEGRVDSFTNLSLHDLSQYQGMPHAGSSSSLKTLPFSLNPYSRLSLSDFSLTHEESSSLSKFELKLFLYIFVKQFAFSKKPDLVLPDLKSCFTQHDIETEQSKIHFIAILPEPAESQQTMLAVLDILHEKHQIGITTDFLVVAGDCKTYDIIIHLKRLYGEELDWVIPYLGEWHLLKNSQPALLKLYSDAGLKTLMSLFHKGATLKAVSSASGFKKTHYFLLQSWEAMYRTLVDAFLQDDSTVEKNLLLQLEREVEQNGSGIFPIFFNSPLAESLAGTFHQFQKFVADKASINCNFKFWSNFCLRDMIFYSGLYIAIRSRDFALRGACIRKLGPIFHALDRSNYLRVVPLHIGTLKTCPSHILKHLQEGAFAISMTGLHNQCLALDEAHEMGINKEVKMAMNAIDPQGLNRLVHYLPFRSRINSNLSKQLLTQKTSLEEDAAHHNSVEANIRQYIEKLAESKAFHGEECAVLIHLFSGKAATPLVTSDLTTYYSTGEDDFIAYVKCFVLADATVKPVRKRRNLHTFAEKRKTKVKRQQELKDHRLQIACLRKQVAWSKSNNAAVSSLDQFMPLPRALCDAEGVPNKGNKASAATFLQKRYPNAFSEKPTDEVLNQGSVCVIMEGMFMINLTRPLDSHKTFGDYARFLFKQWVTYAVRFLKASEVHIIFDHPGRHGVTPKDIERERRDKNPHRTLETCQDTFTAITSATPKPSNWSNFISNRGHKRLLVNYLSQEIINIGKTSEYVPTRLFTAGGFDGEHADKACQLHEGIISFVSNLSSDHEEGDSRVWFHASRTSCHTIVIYSPDRDTFHIGLPLMHSSFKDKQIYVQLRKQFRNDLFVCVNDICSALASDFDLQALGDQLHLAPIFLQMIFICSGCDYVSYFKGQTKLSFLKAFFRNAAFITGGSFPGLLSMGDRTNATDGLYAFYRLIGSVYFYAHAGGFSEENPEEVFHSVFRPGMSPSENHVAFISKIRDGHFHRISDETHWMPSASSLQFHWLRCCWTFQLWSQACSGQVKVPDVSISGWEKTDSGLMVVWDTPENLSQIAQSTHFLQVGCKCKKGCSSNRCKCFKLQKTCAPSCSCTNCENNFVSRTAIENDIIDNESDNNSDSVYSSDSEDDNTLVMGNNNIFSDLSLHTSPQASAWESEPEYESDP